MALPGLWNLLRAVVREPSVPELGLTESVGLETRLKLGLLENSLSLVFFNGHSNREVQVSKRREAQTQVKTGLLVFYVEKMFLRVVQMNVYHVTILGVVKVAVTKLANR